MTDKNDTPPVDKDIEALRDLGEREAQAGVVDQQTQSTPKKEQDPQTPSETE
ncbi:MAG: hypothetical protein ABW164_06510 [Sphingobium sp.]